MRFKLTAHKYFSGMNGYFNMTIKPREKHPYDKYFNVLKIVDGFLTANHKLKKTQG